MPWTFNVFTGKFDYYWQGDFGDLGDVNVGGALNQDLIWWNAVAGEWQPVTPATIAGVINLGDLGDVNLAGLADTDMLTWHLVAGEWRRISLANYLTNLLTNRGDILRMGAALAERYALGAVGQRLEAGALDPAWQWPDSLQNVGGDILTSTAAGIVTQPRQSAVSVDRIGVNQSIPGVVGAWTRINFLTENYDVQNEFNSTQKVGSATATVANHLRDTTLNQFVAGDVGKWVHNTTDNSYAIITVYNSTSDVTLSANIMTIGEGYIVYVSLFTATEAGRYLVFAKLYSLNYADGGFTGSRVYVNGVLDSTMYVISPRAGGNIYSNNICILTLAPGDEVELRAWNSEGANREIAPWLYILKLA